MHTSLYAYVYINPPPINIYMYVYIYITLVVRALSPMGRGFNDAHSDTFAVHHPSPCYTSLIDM